MTHAVVPAEPVAPLPDGFGIAVDASAVELGPGLWYGGAPARVLRLSGAGRAAWDALRGGAAVHDRATGLVARRLTDAGLAHPVPPPLTAAPGITVVVPVRDRAAELDRCLTALGGRYPVVVVDDASHDEVAVRRVAHAHHARVLRLDVNAGPGGARTAGLAVVDTELVAFVDSDTEPTADALAMLAAHLADPLVAAAAPRILAAAGRSAADRYTHARGSLDLGTQPARVAPYTPVSYVPTAVLVARAAAVRDVGGFDPALRYGEDVDLVWRLVAAGHRVRYAPATTVTHHDPATWRGLLTRRFRYGTSAAALSRRHPRNLAPLVVHPWYSTAVAAALARRPLLAGAAAVGAFVTTRRALAGQGVPAQAVQPRHVAHALGQSALGTARYAVQFGTPALLAATAARRTRPAALALLLTPALAEWRRRRPALDPVRFTVAAVADDCAYGGGVVAGCLAHRTPVPLIPAGPRRLRTR